MFDRLHDELMGNRRLRYGAAAIAVLIALYAILVLRDTGQHWRDAADAAEARLDALHNNAGKIDVWRGRAERTRGLLAEYEAEVSHDGTLAQAQAALQDWLTQSLQRAGLRARELNVGGGLGAKAETVRGDAPVKIQARIAFDYQRTALATFMRALLDGPRHVGLERLLVRTTPAPSAEVEVFALYQPIGGASR